jgi:hypothetical protein
MSPVTHRDVGRTLHTTHKYTALKLTFQKNQRSP